MVDNEDYGGQAGIGRSIGREGVMTVKGGRLGGPDCHPRMVLAGIQCPCRVASEGDTAASNCGAAIVEKQYCVYILASRRKGTLYTGMSSDLPKRIHEHKNGVAEGFTRKYAVHRLVYYEAHQDVYAAIAREKQIKRRNRQWKIRLIEEGNPEWKDLSEEVAGTEAD